MAGLSQDVHMAVGPTSRRLHSLDLPEAHILHLQVMAELFGRKPAGRRETRKCAVALGGAARKAGCLWWLNAIGPHERIGKRSGGLLARSNLLSLQANCPGCSVKSDLRVFAAQ